MDLRHNTLPVWFLSIAASLLLHAVILNLPGMYGTIELGAPVMQSRAVMVDLIQPPHSAASYDIPVRQNAEVSEEEGEDIPRAAILAPAAGEALESERQSPDADAGQPPLLLSGREESVGPAAPDGPEKLESAPVSAAVIAGRPVAQPLPPAEAFLASAYEKLTYQISMWGMPVGTAELEASNERGTLRIALKTTSNSAISLFYPVDDLIETRHANGSVIVTSIHQHEGSFRSDIWFSLFLRERQVLWIDRTRSRTAQEVLPSGDVVDTLSGLYFLRQRPLQVGKTEMLHIYDSETYAAVPVEVLRTETIRLRGHMELQTIVIRPLQNTGGIFRRTGDLMIWLSNDDKRVPVKIVSSITLGQVTAELVASETRPFPEATAE